MRKFQRVSDVVEIISERVLLSVGGGVVALLFASVMFYYRGRDGGTLPLAIVLATIAACLFAYGLYHAWTLRRVTRHDSSCPFCGSANQLTVAPDDDFLCCSCQRLIPVKDGGVLVVSQVRCGYCNDLNYYSEKTDVLLCEGCNREIPIAVDETEDRPRKRLASGFAVTDDDGSYELLLTTEGPKHEEMVATLQHMLALNRNQVKQLLDSLPTALLSGIPRKKAELLQAQIAMHGGTAEIRALPDPVGAR